MSRAPTNFFTDERAIVLRDIMGPEADEYSAALNVLGEYSAQELWSEEKYAAINDPNNGREMDQPISAHNGHLAFREAMTPLITSEIGFRGAFLPEIAGGSDMPVPVYMMGLEILAQGNGSIPLSLLIDGSVLNSVWHLGDENQRKRYVQDALENQIMTAFAQTEPGGGSAAADLDTMATVLSDGYRVLGEKNWITNADWAGYYFLVARTNPDRSLRGNGVSIIMVHRDEIDEIRQMRKDTVPGSYTGELIFQDAFVPLEDGGVKRMIGEKDNGFSSAKNLLNGGRVTIAAYSNGLTAEALDMAWAYAVQRESGGEKIAKKQALSFPLAELETGLDAARLLTYRAAMRMQQGDPMRYQDASKAKLFASELALRATEMNWRVHGSYGTSHEFRCNQLRRDVEVAVIGEGTSEVQKGIIASNRRKMYE